MHAEEFDGMANRTRKDGTPMAGADTTPRDPFLVEIGIKILNARRRLGLRQAEVAVRAGVTHSTVFLVENGKQNLSVKSLEALADALDVRARDLLPGEDGPATMDPKDIKQVTESLVGMLGRVTMLMEQVEATAKMLSEVPPPKPKRDR